MSNYGSTPPPGPYTAPTQGTSTPGQNAQPQQNYQPGAPNQARSGKSGGMYGQMLQAVTTGKPMLDKLGKSISSKLGGKTAASGPPQHLQSYQNYQQAHGQGQNQGQGQGQGQYNQPQGYQQQQYQAQTYSPQPQQQQWAHPQQPPGPPPPQAPNPYHAQQSPYQTSNYASPATGVSGQNNYFPTQPNSNAPPPGAPGHNHTAFNATGNTGSDQHYAQQGQHEHQGAAQGQYQPSQPYQTGQYTGVVGGTQSPGNVQNTQNPHTGDVSPMIPPNKPTQWNNSSSSHLPPGPSPGQPYQTVPSPPLPNSQQQTQWNSHSPMTPQGQAPPPPVSPPPHTVSPPPQQTHAQSVPAPTASPQPIQHPTTVVQSTGPPPAPTEFIAELPGDMGPSTPGSPPYQAYQPSGGEQAASLTKRFSVSRRAVSASNLPLADPWRFADPLTEQPTREFYILADLLFEALDRKFEPQNTGLLEAPKVLKVWIELNDEAHELFSFNNYHALARMWGLEGVPHVMVPVQPSLSPVWNFNQHSHAQSLAVVSELQPSPVSYMPALNRAGWYKYFFLEMMHGPDEIGKLVSAICADTYKPGILNQPDLGRRDRCQIPALQARAAQVQSAAIKCVCDEAKIAMQRERNGAAWAARSPQAASASGGANSAHPGSSTDMAQMTHEIQMVSNDIAVSSVADGDVRYESRPAGYSRLV
ncbi:hypothetical protein HBH56_110580 [Parastagonospora nodorum]|uniref:PAT1 multi-domain protein n=1 Tax=Phaeosphaeria nodorum (strain SN15 / ATCC MYA-4574 / FGSC 10173) TaxID=321614 RepID=A0A7U2I692_PHANO|nr:hypothetical protein HBH56_110580 [Parastagonospora nodorum]QRD03350.1 hypothetical protein JI435_101340 [Parastagonospora nodorum SN15]KAH3925467.1 hypothetical protein HBH54_179760 [Parastagonospora nodorum]KAH4138748.1 hypothetical protein HBH45_105920 [Parastagonospora nodorum]KAH4163324.1 hypothetical protein HBH44_081300 [Parastagonospora nodorum]